jgi:ABC-type glycerol-3-phosphate transport system substrate-binding protein
MRSTTSILAALILALSLAGCARSGSDARDDGRVTLIFWHSFVSSTIPALEELIARFEEEHPDIRIRAQYVPTGDALVQKLITAVQSRTAPDISWIHSHYLEELVKADAIYRIDDFADREDALTEEELDDIYPALIQYASWQGTMYSMPMEATNLGLVYNRDHFREVGLDPERPPRTWEELDEYARRLTIVRDGRTVRAGFAMPAVPATGPQGSYMMWTWMPFLWQAGGYLVDTEQTEVLFAEDPGVRALTFWKDLYEAQSLRNFGNDWVVALTSRQASMILDGPWNLPRYPRLLRDMDWAIAPLPAGPAKAATVVAGEYLAIFKQSAHPDAAWRFVKWMIDPDVQAFWSMTSGYLPVRKSVIEVPEFQEFLAENPAQRAFVEQMQVAQAQRPLDYYAIEIQNLLAGAIERATVGGQDPRTVLEEAATRSNQLLRQANAAASASRTDELDE